jgi:hypothetical protein
MSWEGEELGNASLIPLAPQKDEAGDSYLPLIYDFPLGKNISVDDNSALVRPFRRVLEKGKPIGTINYVFYQENNDYFILGSFVYSDRQRIIFFPGILDRRMTISPEGDEVLGKGILRHIDHLSLESSLRTCHLTLLEKETLHAKYNKFNTKWLQDDMFYWFSMSIQDAWKLEPAPMTQEIRLKWHNFSDLKRRYSIIMNSRGDSIFNITRVDDHPQEQFIINFEFFVSRRQSREYIPQSGIYHTGLVPTVKMKDQRKEIMSRFHHILLKKFRGSLWIRVSKITGSQDCICTPKSPIHNL